MDKFSPESKLQFEVWKDKLTKLGSEIKSIVEQGRSIKQDASQLFIFKGMYRELKPYFDTFNATWNKLIELIYDKGGADIFPTKNDKAVFQAVKTYYYEACAIYEEHMNPTPTSSSVAFHQPSHTNTGLLNESKTVRARLPQINLPQFNGSPSEWPLFRDTYKSLIHNEDTLSDMEKFLFLVSCLQGPARSLISNVSLIENNYGQAWKLLTDHYDNKRKLAHTYLKKVLDFKPILGKPTPSSLKIIITSVIEAIDSFKNLGIPDSGDLILAYLVLRCLDVTTQTSFEKKYAQVEFPTYQNIVDFIKTEWKSMDVHYSEPETPVNSRKNFPSPSQPSTSRFYSNPRNSLLTGASPKNQSASSQQHYQRDLTRKRNAQKNVCPVCDGCHSLYQCSQFKSASAEKKITLLKNWNGCLNCLSSKHNTETCTSMRRCTHCNQNHHSWLHHNPTSAPVNQCNAGEGVTLGSTSQEGEVLLGTAIIQIKDSNGEYKNIRVVTDSGSQFSFITLDCANKLGLLVEPTKQKVAGIGEINLSSTIGKVNCSIRSAMPSLSSKELSTEAIAVSKITSNLPHTPLPVTLQGCFKGYALADPQFYKPGPVDFLLGGDLLYDIITGQAVTIQKGIPKLLPTIFGFVVGGPLNSHGTSAVGTSFYIQSQDELKDVMTRFWEIEEVTPVSKHSEEDDYCEKHYQETHYRLDSGRYVVSLPIRPSIVNLENPKNQAFKRLMNLEAKLAKDLKLKSEYHLFMREYLDLEHMKQCSPGSAAYTLPHHAVIKHQDGGLKLRTVFDASCQTPKGSLNEHLFIGPKLQLDIRDILTNFRFHEVVVIADIVKMYRQIVLHPSDRKYQHILWRFDPAEAVKEYELCTVMYGEGPAPFLAQRTVRQLVKDEGKVYPLASKALLEDIYVDDVVTGADSLEEAKELQTQLIALLEKGGFTLSKWASNRQGLVEAVPVTERQVKAISLSSDEEPKIKLLGMQWIPSSDIFTYEIIAPPWHSTKRAILSAIARMYDPLGFLSPVIFSAKTILQDMWLSKFGWDEPGPPQICRRWYQFLSQLSALSDVKIPRYICNKISTSPIIIGFSDASQRGYSAVLYILTIINNQHNIHLLKAKNKLAPTKPMTIPRLELSGALLLVNLLKSCDKLINKLNISGARFFTDSEVVLGWLSAPPQTLNAFVAHRVVQILEVTNRSQWGHVRSEHNPADCSSRGLLPNELPNHPLWWAGPPWLRLPLEQWPQKAVKVDKLPEIKKTPLTSLTAAHLQVPNLLKWMENSSSYMKLLRSMSYALRFIKFIGKLTPEKGPIKLHELRKATAICIKVTQKFYKPDKIHLKSLHAFIDEVGILRVGGRLQNSTLSYDAKHPIIISGKSHLAKLIVDYYHRSYLHLGSTGLQAILHSKYWIINARKLIRRCVFECTTCYKANQSPKAPLMGNLPTSRVQGGQVFCHVGVDFAGPFTIRESSRRKAIQGKCYLCLFICMATKAVHLEVVSKCSTEAFLASFDRFIARRGKPSDMYSDCGTNFVGAANKLKDIILWLKSLDVQKEILNYATQQDISWSFNPPAAPHFGGIWEAGIKSTKTILNKIIGETPLTFEELATLFCKIEGILNSRPLTPLSSDPSSIECLTPGYFLVGRPLIAAPEHNILNSHIPPLKRWEMLQQRSQQFWIRWKKEYLHTLQQRRKWTDQTNDIKIGDLVIVKDMDTPQRTWPLARVTETHPGADGVTRVVTIKTSSGLYKRPVIKLIPLTPVNNNDKNN